MGLSTYFETKGDKGIVIFAGKGGLGKTTCSAGLSHYMASKRNRKVLCFSTDPQASLSDIFDRDIFGKGLVPVIPNLDVVEIDADRRVADYQGEVKQKILTMYGLSELPTEIEEYIDSTSAEPAMYESATYDATADVILHGPDSGAHGDPRHGTRARDVRCPRSPDGRADREPGLPRRTGGGERRRGGRVPPQPRAYAAEVPR